MAVLENLPSDFEMIILELLKDDEEMYGLQFVAADPEVLLENSIYVILTRMIARGFLTARYETKDEGKKRGPRRRLYRITTRGREMRKARLEVEKVLEKYLL